MLAPQRISPIYPISRYNNSIQGTVAFRLPPLDVDWTDRWPIIKTIILGTIMLISSAAIIGLDIANLALEGKKTNGGAEFGIGTAKVGAGLWSGSISFLGAIFIIVIIFVNNKRIAATFALIVVTLAFFFTIVLIGLTANAIQLDKLYPDSDLNRIQYKLIISILSIGAFILTLCLTYFIMYIRVYFSSYTRRSTKY